METLPDLVARDRRSDRPALQTVDREMDYRRFCTTVWKTSNYLRHLGVGGGRGIAVLADRSAPPLLSFLGAALLDTPTAFAASPADLSEAIDAVEARAVLVPSHHEGAIEPPAGTSLVVHGEDPTAATTEHWAEGVWSENPAFVPSTASPDSIGLVTTTREVSHGELLDGAKQVAAEAGLTEDSVVGVAGSLSDPAVIAGALAPLVGGGCLVIEGTAEIVVSGETSGLSLA